MSENNQKNNENEIIDGQITVEEALKSEKSDKILNEELTTSKEDKKTKGFKLTPRTIAELAALEGKFSSAEELMKAMISTYRTQRANEVGYESRIKDIDQFNSLVESLRILFIASVELEKTTNNRVELEFRSKIESLTKSVAVLTSEKIELTHELKENNELYESLTKENKELLKQLEVIQDLVNSKEGELVKNREQINTLTSLLNEYKEYKQLNKNLAKSIKDIQIILSEKEKALNECEVENRILNNNIENLNSNIMNLNDTVSDNKNMILELKDENKILRDKLEKAKDDLNTAKMSVNDAKYEINLLTKDLENKSDEANSKESEIEVLKAELNAVKGQLELYEKGYETYESLYIDKLHAKDEEIDALKKELDSLKTKKKKVAKSAE